MFFFLTQTEQGDIFKVTLETDDDMVTEIRMKYFDTVPVAASMNVLKTGFLFIASEYGNQWVKDALPANQWMNYHSSQASDKYFP